ncbi:alpha/beta fold hydrolase [Streptomyces gamaensis]|uniref:Alpha/beta fold hydrolase n=1 Tax=Streptomyces gamaensis TaxID=1763542 RepID=A0ABW0Z8Z5_9ACTN
MQERHCRRTTGTAPTRDGRALFYTEFAPPTGDGPATVVLESGLAASRSYWALVQQAVAASARVVAYDRSGLGRSAPDPRPRRLQRLADDLGDLLDHLGAGPFVLVGHSWGGLVVRLAAARRPERTAGLVLLDPTDESCDLLLDPSMRRLEKAGAVAGRVLARTGLLPLLFRKVTTALPPQAAAEMRAEAFTVGAMRTHRAEQASVGADLRALRDNPPELGGIPVTVVSATRRTPGMSARAREAINAAHAYRARQSPAGRHVLAPRADHIVPVTDPATVVTEIERLLGPVPDTP